MIAPCRMIARGSGATMASLIVGVILDLSGRTLTGSEAG